MSAFDDWLATNGKSRETADAMDEIAWLRLERQRLSAHAGIAGPDHAELAKVMQSEVVRLRAQVDQLRDEVADAKKWAMQERSQRWALPAPLSDAERDAIEWASKTLCVGWHDLAADDKQRTRDAAATLQGLLDRLA